MWLGQAPQTDYMKERTHGTFRHWLEYSGGMLTDWGAHHNDIAQWGLGTDRSGPIAVEGTGKRDDRPNCYNAFYEFNVTFTYPNDITLLCSNTGENGVEFIGEEGSIFVSRGTIRASDQKLLEDPLPANAIKLYVSNDHHGNFVDCIRSGKPTICDAEIGYRSVSVCHLANICLRLGGGKLEWDPKREQFDHSKDANALLSRPQRPPWHV
jgi:predicted dehydrogenase